MFKNDFIIDYLKETKICIILSIYVDHIYDYTFQIKNQVQKSIKS